MTLFIAKYDLEKREYLGDNMIVETGSVALVRADDIRAAEAKLEDHLNRPDPYGTSYRIVNVELSACIE